MALRQYLYTNKNFSIFYSTWVIVNLVIWYLFSPTPEGDEGLFPFWSETYAWGDLLIWGFIIPYLGYDYFWGKIVGKRHTPYEAEEEEDLKFSTIRSQFVRDYELSIEILKIIKQSNKFLAIVSPYIKLSPNIKKELRLKQSLDTEIYLIFGKNVDDISKSLNNDDLSFFKEFKNIRISHLPDLHAKFYANEFSMLLCSMNLVKYSQVMNAECGLIINPSSYFERSSNKIWNEVLEYFDEIYECSDKLFINTPGEEKLNESESKNSNTEENIGRISESSTGDFLKSTRKGYPNSYASWTEEEEEKLAELFDNGNGKSISEIAKIHGRKYGGIKSRLQKLGIIER